MNDLDTSDENKVRLAKVELFVVVNDDSDPVSSVKRDMEDAFYTTILASQCTEYTEMDRDDFLESEWSEEGVPPHMFDDLFGKDI